MNGRYGGYGGYGMYGGNYRGNYSQNYARPVVSEYESFFNPIPIDFLQQNLQQHQGRYDTAYAGTLQAKELMMQQESALTDIAGKNEIINRTLGDVDKLVADRYGGDWGKASKDIARTISSARQDPFWESSKYLKEQQKIEQAFRLQSPDAHIYRSALGTSTIDPMSGDVRSAEDLTFEGGKKGDWRGSVRAQFADVEGTQLVEKLKRLTGETEGYLGIKTVRDLTDTQLRVLADDPYAVASFLEDNPDFEESKRRIEGLTSEEIKKEVSDYIYGHIRQKAQKVESQQTMQDKGYFDSIARRHKNTYPWGGFGETEMYETGFNSDGTKKEKRVLNQIYDEDGMILSDQDIKELRRQPKIGFLMIGSHLKVVPRNFKFNEYRDNLVERQRETVNYLRRFSPDFKNMNDMEVMNEFMRNAGKYSNAIHTVVPLLDMDMSLSIGQTANGNISGTEYYLKKGQQTTRDYNYKNGVGDVLNIPYQAMRQLMIDETFAKGYDLTEASYYIEVGKFGKNDLVMLPDGGINWAKSGSSKEVVKVYFSPDTESKNKSQMITGLNKAVKTGDFEEIKALHPNIEINEELIQNIIAAGLKDKEGKNVDINSIPFVKLNPNAQGYASLNQLRMSAFIKQTENLGSFYEEKE